MPIRRSGNVIGVRRGGRMPHGAGVVRKQRVARKVRLLSQRGASRSIQQDGSSEAAAACACRTSSGQGIWFLFKFRRIQSPRAGSLWAQAIWVLNREGLAALRAHKGEFFQKKLLYFGIPRPPRGEVLCGEVPELGVSQKLEQHVVIKIIRKSIK